MKKTRRSAARRFSGQVLPAAVRTALAENRTGFSADGLIVLHVIESVAGENDIAEVMTVFLSFSDLNDPGFSWLFPVASPRRFRARDHSDMFQRQFIRSFPALWHFFRPIRAKTVFRQLPARSPAAISQKCRPTGHIRPGDTGTWRKIQQNRSICRPAPFPFQAGRSAGR